ncbi:pyridoxal phosphate-dependent aminotransferase [Ammoniphilus sp. CFH 90114]|uniref:pyridoxal phosphate-dependent aminotransferase n=1 Tax=Ammoniphilus sp. CFH 90114 TaxID=2493665 RepID=UPI00100F565A|nr:pyridoxal phosphate-dependent aminotransferase [Ammoniphilus sp. CFH 90114]RXT07099.1 pyridoxal phosphate-dependent aminotransferase [Ammoniphilus sp. CFH 90114]
MKEISQRILSIPPSPTGTLNARTQELIKQGKNILNFTIGEPDFKTPLHIQEAAIMAIREGHTRYTANEGMMSLRKAIATKFKADNQLDYETDQIVVSNGAKHSLFNLYQALLNPGDEVILQTPYWVSYPTMIELAGGTPILVPTTIDTQFKMTPQLIKNYLTPRTKVLHLNSPSNPTGMIYTQEELEELGKLAIEHDLWIVSDEIYEKLIYEERHVSIASLDPQLYERTITVNGMSKAYAMTGWRVGYMAGDAALMKKVTSFQSHTTSNASSVSQMAALAALTGDQGPVEEMRQQFYNRRELMTKGLAAIPGTRVMKPNGAFYLFIEVKGWIEKLELQHDLQLAESLLYECGIAVVPGSAFGLEGYLRFSFANSEEEIQQAIERLSLKFC